MNKKRAKILMDLTEKAGFHVGFNYVCRIFVHAFRYKSEAHEIDKLFLFRTNSFLYLLSVQVNRIPTKLYPSK